MRFGPFVLPTSPAHDQDSRVIDLTLDQVSLAEDLGYEYAWLTEHHFTGDNAYADPLIFGSAVAVRTKKIRIGFAVVQMALHHPIRLAVQTALLDNLSHGRLTVGVGRGSGHNFWEYEGFGTALEDGAERLEEAEELLQEAWTGHQINHAGKYWQVSLPEIQPAPYQKPHPPLVRACVSPKSVEAMGRAGRPIMLTFLPLPLIAERMAQLRQAMESAGRDEASIEHALDETWIHKAVYVADNASQAASESLQGFGADVAQLQATWDRMGGPARKFGSILDEQNLIAGSPEGVAARVEELRKAGARNIMFTMTPGGLPPEKIAKSMRLFAAEVAPRFR